MNYLFISILIISILYYVIVFSILKKGKNEIEKNENIDHNMHINDIFVNKSVLNTKDEFPTNSSFDLDESAFHEDENVLLNAFKETNKINLEGESKILNTNKNYEKNSKKGDFKVIKNDKKKKE